MEKIEGVRAYNHLIEPIKPVEKIAKDKSEKNPEKFSKPGNSEEEKNKKRKGEIVDIKV